jgi:hypothetical protein
MLATALLGAVVEGVYTHSDTNPDSKQRAS